MNMTLISIVVDRVGYMQMTVIITSALSITILTFTVSVSERLMISFENVGDI